LLRGRAGLLRRQVMVLDDVDIRHAAILCEIK